MYKRQALARTVRNHYTDIFAYWDAPTRITNAYTESLNGLCLLYTSDAADERSSVDLGGRRIIKKKTYPQIDDTAAHAAADIKAYVATANQ